MEEEELFKRVTGILDNIKGGRIKQAIVMTEEVLNYQIDEEVSGRIRNALTKLRKDDVSTAVTTIERVADFLNKRLSVNKKTDTMPISESDISVRILYVVDDISKFKRKDAITKLRDLQKYEIGSYVYRVADETAELLEDYDEVSADKLLQKLLADLKTASSADLAKRDTEEIAKKN